MEVHFILKVVFVVARYAALRHKESRSLFGLNEQEADLLQPVFTWTKYRRIHITINKVSG